MAPAFLPPVALPASGRGLAPVNARRLPRREAAAPSRAPVMVISEDKEVAKGDKYLTPDALERAKAGHKIEKMKLEKDGSAMWTEVYELAALLRAGETKWEDIAVDDIDSRLKWAGMFHRRKRTPGRFMVRLKVPNGILNSKQLRFFHESLLPHGADGCGDITTRMNIQLRGLQLDDMGDLTNGLLDHGLTSFMSGMDNVRNMVGSPIAGIDPYETVDTRELCKDINDMITGDRRGRAELTNLPRKFNIAVSGGRDDFAHTHINDIGLTPVLHPDTGEIGFNVVVGGFFSIKRNEEAIPMDAWIPYGDVVDFCEAVLLWFRDNGDRKVRQASRLMYMIDQLGTDGFKAAIETQMGKPIASRIPTNYTDEWVRRDVTGIHPQKQEGFSWVCANVPAGRFATEDFATLADLADEFSGGEMRITVEQNVLFPNVKNEDVDKLTAHPIFEKFKIRPGKMMNGLVACTGAQFCGVAIIETKNRAIAVAKKLDEMYDLPRDVRMHWTGCPNSCAQVQCADIGLMGAPARKDGKAVEGCNIYLGGRIGEGAELGEVYKKRQPAAVEDIVPVLGEILIEKFGATPKA